jgi:glycosyltransferase involved in cell wall biosynthesis
MALPRKILHLKNGSYEKCIVKRNALNRVLSMHLNGFFQEVYLVFFKTETDKQFDLNARCHIYDSAGTKTLFSRIGLKFVDTLLSEIKFLRLVYGLIRRNDISVITADEPFVTGLNAVIIGFLARKPTVIYNLADFDLFFKIGGQRNIPFLPRFVERFIEARVFKSACLVITDRKFYRDYVLRRGAPYGNCAFTRVTTDNFYFSAVPEKEFKKNAAWEGKKALFYFGRLHAEKKTDYLIRCLALIQERRPDAILLIAGEGPQSPLLKELSKTLGVEKSVFFLGSMNNQELVNIMSMSDILLATHAGYSLLEMALSGKPIIAFDFEWHNEFIENNVNGILVKDGDVRAMAAEALKLLSDKNRGLLLGRRAREKALCFHSPDDALYDEEKCYRFLLNRQV